MPKLPATLALASIVIWGPVAGPTLSVPNRAETVKFAVLGDNGSGSTAQYDVANQMAAMHRLFAFGLVIMLGDNFYGSQTPGELFRKFDRPYKALLDSGVTFQAAIGNHDEPVTVNYPALNMAGHRYYTYVRRQVRFFVLDTNIMDPPQLAWFRDRTAAGARAVEDRAYFHHPLYGNAGRHGSAVDMRLLLEPLFVKYGVAVVFSGHDHIYDRLKPQNGIYYFVAGSGGQRRKGDLVPSASNADR